LMIDSFSEAEKLLLVLDMIPKFSDLIVVTILSSYLGGQYKRRIKNSFWCFINLWNTFPILTQSKHKVMIM